MDMVLYFDSRSSQLTKKYTEAVLIGKTYDGKTITGKDTVRIVSKGKH